MSEAVKRVVLYARISTTEKRQNWRVQLQELRQMATHRGWTVVAEFHDVASGRKDKRAGLAAAMKICRAGGADVFAVVDVDRIARSTLHFLRFLGELEAMKVRLACSRDGNFDTTTPHGEAMLHMRAVFAQLEGRLIGQRIKETLAVKKSHGMKLGAPRQYDYAHLPTVIRLRRAKPPTPWKKIAERFGGTHGGWQRAVWRTTKAAA